MPGKSACRSLWKDRRSFLRPEDLARLSVLVALAGFVLEEFPLADAQFTIRPRGRFRQLLLWPAQHFEQLGFLLTPVKRPDASRPSHAAAVVILPLGIVAVLTFALRIIDALIVAYDGVERLAGLCFLDDLP